MSSSDQEPRSVVVTLTEEKYALLEKVVYTIHGDMDQTEIIPVAGLTDLEIAHFHVKDGHITGAMHFSVFEGEMEVDGKKYPVRSDKIRGSRIEVPEAP